MSTGLDERLLAQYHGRHEAGQADAARRGLLDGLAGAPEAAWLACARALVLRADLTGAQAVLDAAAARFPDSTELRLALAGLALQAARSAEAERLLYDLLADHPGHVAAAFLLYRALHAQGRLQAAAGALRRLFEQGPQDIDTTIQAIEWLDDVQRPADALAICEGALAGGAADPRLHAYAGMLCLQLGKFDRVRGHYDIVLAHTDHAAEWNVPAGLASLQRYTDPAHPDLALLRQTLERSDLSDATRAATLFALAKASDDLGDLAHAAACLRQANALARTRSNWSRKQWRRLIEARLAAPRFGFARPANEGWAPLFIVGVPRSGTTLLAERLARHPAVRNRGELGLIGELARQLQHAPRDRAAAFEPAANHYAAQLRQDDAPARWYIDKQPLNLLHLDLILALWPGARILYCERNARDTALSLWSQSFHDPAHDYACDLDDIAAVIHGCRRLMGHWQRRFGDAIRTVRYETLVEDPDACLAGLAEWLGLPAAAPATDAGPSVIRSASHWQARQPVYRHALGRWRRYAEYVPELLRLPDA